MGHVKQYFTELIERAHNDDAEAQRLLIESGHGDLVDCCFNAAKEYLKLGWSVVPQLPGAKMPLVKWKTFQERLPTEEELNEWFERWPDAGVAIVLGTVSNLFVIDVDGEEAHEALVEHLGGVPKTLKALSGSGKPFRYHLYFSHPADIPTKAKFTPWHRNLEFRGNRGIVVTSPSLHKSGKRYEWEQCRLPYRQPLPLPPEPILEALRAKQAKIRAIPPISQHSEPGRSIQVPPGVCFATKHFLAGMYSNASGWNDRIFHAACDVAGNGIPLEEAIPLLVAGARPWNPEEEQNAIRTIESAYAEPRGPARAVAAQGKAPDLGNSGRGAITIKLKRNKDRKSGD